MNFFSKRAGFITTVIILSFTSAIFDAKTAQGISDPDLEEQQAYLDNSNGGGGFEEWKKRKQAGLVQPVDYSYLFKESESNSMKVNSDEKNGDLAITSPNQVSDRQAFFFAMMAVLAFILRFLFTLCVGLLITILLKFVFLKSRVKSKKISIIIIFTIFLAQFLIVAVLSGGSVDGFALLVSAYISYLMLHKGFKRKVLKEDEVESSRS